MNEKREFQNPVSIAELAAEREAQDQTQYRQVLGKLQSAGGSAKSEIPISEILELPQHELQTPGEIQILTNHQIVNQEKNGDEKSLEQAKTWKDKTDKRKADKASRRV